VLLNIGRGAIASTTARRTILSSGAAMPVSVWRHGLVPWGPLPSIRFRDVPPPQACPREGGGQRAVAPPVDTPVPVQVPEFLLKSLPERRTALIKPIVSSFARSHALKPGSISATDTGFRRFDEAVLLVLKLPRQRRDDRGNQRLHKIAVVRSNRHL
jgi:hypothetical protein